MYIKLKDLLLEALNESAKSATLFSASRSKRTEKFRKLASLLPTKIQAEMIRKFQEWLSTGELQNIRQLAKHSEFYKLDLPQEYRAVAKYNNGYLIWVWVGSHEAYNREVQTLTGKYANVMLKEDDLGDVSLLFNPDGSVNL